MDDNTIISKISANARAEVESRQIFKRMSELLPDTLSGIEAKYRTSERPGRARRLALVSEEYEKAISDILLFRERALEARVQSETHRMLIKARQSLNSFIKVARAKGLNPQKALLDSTF